MIIIYWCLVCLAMFFLLLTAIYNLFSSIKRSKYYEERLRLLETMLLTLNEKKN